MTVTFDLPDDALVRLRAEASRRGVSIDTVIAEFASGLPATPSPGPARQPGFVALGRSSSGRAARDADEMLADGFGSP
jgi:hypothetical protein